MDTWLLLYPTTKAWASLKFYTTITLNIQFLNVFTEPAMHYRGAFHLCLKQNPKKEKRRGREGGSKVIGFRCFSYNAGYLSLHNPQTCRAPAAPTEHSADAAPTPPGGGGGGFQRRWSSCVCVFRGGLTDRDVENLWRKEAKPAGLLLSFFFFDLCLCMFLFKVVKIKSTTKNVHLPVLSKLWH